jgi:formate-dependent nitrite reductase membrane component NrfD
MQNIGLDGQESNCMELLAPVLFYLCCCTGLICDLALAQAVKHNQPAEREMLQAARQSATAVLAMSAVPVVLHSHGAYYDSGIRDAQ